MATDEDDDDAAGNLSVSATMDGSGGAGSPGGSARNDGAAGTVAAFGTGNLTLEVNADFDGDGSGRGAVTVSGVILATGGVANGSGGDVSIWGTVTAQPSPGSSVDGTGAGADGDVLMNGVPQVLP
jgi:hypothetical protein